MSPTIEYDSVNAPRKGESLWLFLFVPFTVSFLATVKFLTWLEEGRRGTKG